MAALLGTNWLRNLYREAVAIPMRPIQASLQLFGSLVILLDGIGANQFGGLPPGRLHAVVFGVPGSMGQGSEEI